MNSAPNPPGVRKLVQVSEEAQQPVHVPVVLGNECYVVTQQDVRKIEDTRFIAYHKLGPNGELIPVEAAVGQDNALREAITCAAAFHTQNQCDLAAQQQLLQAFLSRCSSFSDLNANSTPTPIKATIAQQMEWSNSCSNSTPAYPLTYSKSTSNDDMLLLKNDKCCEKPCCCTCKPRYVTNQGCNTIDTTTDQDEGKPSARKTLKIRKLLQDTLGI